jgi:hypothetical protein
MKRVILTFIMLFPAALIAQQDDSNFPVRQRDAAGSEQTKVASVKIEEGFSTEANADAVVPPSSTLALEAPRQPAGTQAPSSSSSQGIERPKIEGSMVGYIDNAIIGSQIRIRFEAAFSDSNPDLAEFFYAKCGCYKSLASVIPAAYDPNAPGPGPGIPTSLNYQQLYFNGEYAPSQRFSVFAEVPLRWIEPLGFRVLPPLASFTDRFGISDVRAGVKLGAIATANSSLTFQLQAYFPSGNASNAMGTNHYSVEPALLYYQRFSPRLALEAQLGDWHPIGGSSGVPVSSSEGFAGDVFFYGVGPSYKLYSGEHVTFAPVIEMVGWRILSGFETQPAGPVLGAAKDMSGTNIVNLKIGARTTIGSHNSFYVGFGQGLTTTKWYNQILRVEYRYLF